MRPAEHLAASLILGPAAWLLTGDMLGAVIAATVQTGLDVDHLIEHLFKGARPFSLREFTAPLNSLNWPRMHFLLHSHEAAAGLAAAGWLLHSPILVWIAVGYAVHLLLDETGNRRASFPIAISPWFYFLTWRASKRFETRIMTWVRPEQSSHNPAFAHLMSGPVRDRIPHE